MNMASIFCFPDSHFTGLSHDTQHLAKRQLHGDDYSRDELDLIAGTLAFHCMKLLLITRVVFKLYLHVRTKQLCPQRTRY